MSKNIKGPKPVKSRLRARVKTRERGGNITPSNSRPRSRTKGRYAADPDARGPENVPSGIKAEGTRGKRSGDYQSNTIPTKFDRSRKAWRKTGDAKTKSNPLT